MATQTPSRSSSAQPGSGDEPSPSRSLVKRMLRLAAVLLVLALAAMAYVASDDQTIPFEYEGFD